MINLPNLTYTDPRVLGARDRKFRKRHSKQLEYLKGSIARWGFNEPVAIRDGLVVHGELRVIAAIEFGLETIPTVELAHLTDEQCRAYAIAANQIALLAGFDEEALRVELGELAELDIDVSALGFENADLDRILGLSQAETDARLDDIAGLDQGPAVAKLGDLWLLGDRHRLYCGDALKLESYHILMGDERAQMLLSDPPYNDKVSLISGNGKMKHREFIQASGELTDDQFTKFLTIWLRLVLIYGIDGALYFIFMSWRHLLPLLRAGNIVFGSLKAFICWVKQQGGMGALYRSQSEYVAVFKGGTAPHINNVQLGRYGRNRTNVWHMAGMNSISPDRNELLSLHPTVKPVDLFADAILDCSNIDDIILDSFVGSGTIFLAAEQTRRRARGLELDPLYVDVSLRRFRKAYGVEPIHTASGQTLSQRENLAMQSAESEKVT